MRLGVNPLERQWLESIVPTHGAEDSAKKRERVARATAIFTRDVLYLEFSSSRGLFSNARSQDGELVSGRKILKPKSDPSCDRLYCICNL